MDILSLHMLRYEFVRHGLIDENMAVDEQLSQVEVLYLQYSEGSLNRLKKGSIHEFIKEVKYTKAIDRAKSEGKDLNKLYCCPICRGLKQQIVGGTALQELFDHECLNEDRSRWEGCRFCEGEGSVTEEHLIRD